MHALKQYIHIDKQVEARSKKAIISKAIGEVLQTF